MSKNIDLTPSAMGYAKMLWVIANDSENAEDRQWAKTQLLEGYAQTHERVRDEYIEYRREVLG